MTNSREVLLAFDAAVAGGSISLIRRGDEIASKIGTGNVLKAENLLPQINELLAINKLLSKDITHIAVSAGPGSFTGIRIGLATAMGLARALNIKISTVSALKAIAAASDAGEKIISALPMGRDAVCIQEYFRSDNGVEEKSSPLNISESNFTEILQKTDKLNVVLHVSLERFVNDSRHKVNVVENLALHIGRYSILHPEETQTPLFISKNF